MRHPFSQQTEVRIPLLIALGANDSRVKRSESEQIVAAIEKNGAHQRRTCCIPTRATASFALRTFRISWRAWSNSLPSIWAVATSQMNGERIEGSSAIVRVIGRAQ